MLFKRVKQTSDATLDSRILVSAADLAVTRARKLAFGAGGSGGIDVDEFVGKLISYMRNSPNANNPRARRNEDSDSEDDIGDAFDWSYLGRTAALKATKRAPMSDFLLGPLTVQKRARLNPSRTQPDGTQTLGRKSQKSKITRPTELKPEEIHAQENTTTQLVLKIVQYLKDYMIKMNRGTEGGVNFFKFVLNPHSFSQSVENMFYVSFLIRDGRAALWEGEDGLPCLALSNDVGPEQAKQDGVIKQQVIGTLDVWSWKELCKELDIHEPVIPLREKELGIVTDGGWYG